MDISTSTREELFFDSIKESRGWYFVEHLPPGPGHPRFGALQLAVLDGSRTPDEIAAAMESELADWTRRFPVPMMVTAFDDTDSVISLKEVRGSNSLIGWYNPESDGVEMHWQLLPDDELPTTALDTDVLKEIYAGVDYRTREDCKAEAEATAKQHRRATWILIGWFAGVPLAIAVLEWWSVWLGFMMLLYAAYKALRTMLQMLGKLPKSERQKRRAEDEARMRHHHYHCEQNPDGFWRIKAENFERWARERTHAEAAEIRDPSQRDHDR